MIKGNMQYNEVIKTLEGLQSGRIHPQLDSIRAATKHFGNPQNRFKSIHIAGTNGKGSVAAFTASILKTCGLKTGLYTSPHIFDFTERISIDGTPISQQETTLLAEEAIPAIERFNCTYFESATLLAFLFFARRGVDAAVIETGLGGGWDATNIIQSNVSVLMHIAVDHEKYLGASLAGIAREKAGIIKTGGTCILSKQDSEVKEIIVRHARTMGARIIDLENETESEILESSLTGSTFNYTFGNERIQNVRVPLAGMHQVHNAAAAMTACLAFGEMGARFDSAGIGEGIARCRWKGRFEVIEDRPLFIVDVAHNPDAFNALKITCEMLLPGRRLILLFGVMKDKDYRGMLEKINPLAKAVVGVPLPGGRALPPPSLAELFLKSDVPYFPCGTAADAVRTARSLAGPDDVLLAAGSHLTVEAVVSAMAREK